MFNKTFNLLVVLMLSCFCGFIQGETEVESLDKSLPVLKEVFSELNTVSKLSSLVLPKNVKEFAVTPNPVNYQVRPSPQGDKKQELVILKEDLGIGVQLEEFGKNVFWNASWDKDSVLHYTGKRLVKSKIEKFRKVVSILDVSEIPTRVTDQQGNAINRTHLIVEGTTRATTITLDYNQDDEKKIKWLSKITLEIFIAKPTKEEQGNNKVVLQLQRHKDLEHSVNNTIEKR